MPNLPLILVVDLHNTLVRSNDAWLKAFLFEGNIMNADFIERKIYLKNSRRMISKQVNADYNKALEQYSKNIRPNAPLLRILSDLQCAGLPIVIVTSAGSERITKDIDRVRRFFTPDGIFDKTKFNKSNRSDWTALLKKFNAKKALYIGNDVDEDVIDHKNVVTLLVGDFLSKKRAILKRHREN